MLLWSVEDRSTIPVLLGQTDDVTEASFSPDGNFVVLLGADGTSQIYACPQCGSNEDLLKEASHYALQRPQR